MPEIQVNRDFDGYFEALVRQLCERKKGDFNFKKLIVVAQPYQPDAVEMFKPKKDDGTLDHDTCVISFYSALRNGFGHLSEADLEGIVTLL